MEAFIQQNYFFITAILFVLGACIGSFMNVCIYRLPEKGMSVVQPGSHCPSCKKTVKWYDNIPLVSYAVLKGACRHCGARISLRYILVEAVTAFVFVEYFILFGATPQFVCFTILTCLLIVATAVDFKHQIIPDEVNFIGIIIGLIGSFIFPELHHVSTKINGLLEGFLGFLAGGGSIFLIGIFGNIVFRKESMGGGDVKLMAMIGTFLGWKLVLLTFFIAPFFGAVVGLYAKYVKKAEIIPYGPFLSMGALIALFWGQRIIQFVFYS